MASINHLSGELLLHLLSFFEPTDIIRCQCLSRRFVHFIRENLEKMRPFTDVDVFIEQQRRLDETTVINVRLLKLLRWHAKVAKSGSFVFTIRAPDQQGEDERSVTCIVRHFKRESKSLKEMEFITRRQDEMSKVVELIETIRRHFSYSAVCFVDVKKEVIEAFHRILSSPTNVGFYDTVISQNFLTEFITTEGITELSLRDSGWRRFPRRFFENPAIRKLTHLRFGLSPSSWSDLDDEKLLELRNTVGLSLGSLRTRLTLEGIQKVIKEWIDGRRRIEFLRIAFDDVAPDDVYSVLHSCGDLCNVNYHFDSSPLQKNALLIECRLFMQRSLIALTEVNDISVFETLSHQDEFLEDEIFDGLV